jgi:Pectate lyase superfamily protein
VKSADRESMRQVSQRFSIITRVVGSSGFVFLLLLLAGKATGQSIISDSSSPFTSVRDAPFSASGDGVTNDREAFRMALTSGISIYVPAGVYLVDNSTGPLSISDFSSTLQFSPAAQIVCNTPNIACLVFSGGNSPIFLNLRVTYLIVPTNDCRHGETLCVTLLFDSIHSPVIQGTVVENGWAIGVSINNTDNAKIVNTTVKNSTRDALFLQDNQNVEVANLFVQNSGDDCIGFHSTSDGSGRKGGKASAITCQNIRGGGIAFAGGEDISVSDFVVNGSSAQGIYIMSDPSQKYLVPTNITITHGVIRGVGSVADTVVRKGTQNGIQYYTVGGATIGQLKFADILIESTAGYGLIGESAKSVSFDGVRVSNAGLDGIVSDGSCAKFWAHGSLTLTNSSLSGCYRVGLLATGNTNVSIDQLSVTNAWTKGTAEPGGKAVDLVGNSNIYVNNISITDHQNPATGFILNENQNSGGQVTKIYSQIDFGALRVINGSPTVSIH